MTIYTSPCPPLLPSRLSCISWGWVRLCAQEINLPQDPIIQVNSARQYSSRLQTNNTVKPGYGNHCCLLTSWNSFGGIFKLSTTAVHHMVEVQGSVIKIIFASLKCTLPVHTTVKNNGNEPPRHFPPELSPRHFPPELWMCLVTQDVFWSHGLCLVLERFHCKKFSNA